MYFKLVCISSGSLLAPAVPNLAYLAFDECFLIYNKKIVPKNWFFDIWLYFHETNTVTGPGNNDFSGITAWNTISFHIKFVNSCWFGLTVVYKFHVHSRA